MVRSTRARVPTFIAVFKIACLVQFPALNEIRRHGQTSPMAHGAVISHETVSLLSGTSTRREVRDSSKRLMIQTVEDSVNSGSQQAWQPRETTSGRPSVLANLQKRVATELLLALHCASDTEDLLMGARQLRRV